MKQIYRSRHNRMIAGVCGGLAEYFNIDPTIVRIAWVLLGLVLGWGILLYIAALIIIPEQSYTSGEGQGFSRTYNWDSKTVSLIIGGALIFLGLIILGRRFFWWLDMQFLWPLILIAVGLLVIFKRK